MKRSTIRFINRKLLFVAMTGLIIVWVILYSCSKTHTALENSSELQDQIMDSICPTCENYKIWLPDETIIKKVETKDETEIVFIAPEGYVYLGYTTDSSLIDWVNKSSGRSSVSVTCDCTNGSDENCSPVGNGGEVSCVIEAGCTTCDRVEKAKNDETKEEYEILQGGFVNLNIGITFAQPEDELPYAFEALLDYPEVEEQIISFMNQFYDDMSEIPVAESDGEYIIAPEGYKFVVLNVYGRALVTLLPDTKSINAAGGYTYSCPCNGTSGKCKVKSTWGYYYCKKSSSDPCNEACNTMTVDDDNNKATYTYTYYFF